MRELDYDELRALSDDEWLEEVCLGLQGDGYENCCHCRREAFYRGVLNNRWDRSLDPGMNFLCGFWACIQAERRLDEYNRFAALKDISAMAWAATRLETAKDEARSQRWQWERRRGLGSLAERIARGMSKRWQEEGF